MVSFFINTYLANYTKSIKLQAYAVNSGVCYIPITNQSALSNLHLEW